MGRKKKTKICDKVSHGEADRISQLPEHLICEILYHLPTKDAVRTSVLSTQWRYLWLSVPGLDLEPFSNSNTLCSLVERFFDFHRESCIRKFRVNFVRNNGMDYCPTQWIDVVIKSKIQHLDVCCLQILDQIPPSIYTCETLVHLRLYWAFLPNAEFVCLPCLKIMHLEHFRYPNEATLEKLISGSLALQDLTIIKTSRESKDKVQVRSHTLKRIRIDYSTQVVIDAPLLQCLKTKVYLTKNFEILNSGFSGKLDIDSVKEYREGMICDILTDVTDTWRVKDLVISNLIWKGILQYFKSGPVLQFRDLSRLNVKFSKSDLEMLPILLESCPKLESFVLELVKGQYMFREKKDPKVMFSTVPQCLVSSLKFVEWKRAFSLYEGEMELIRYFLKNSTILEKFRLDAYYTEKAKCALLQELLAMPRCSSICQIHYSFIPRKKSIEYFVG